MIYAGYIFFIISGFLSGSVMYSQLLPYLVRQIDITQAAADGNPGAGNVFQQLGPVFGIPCLLCDILKGTIPVALCLHFFGYEHPLFALVISAPVLGHAKKGKAIAVSFGVLLGLMPSHAIVFYLVVPFVFFSALVRINPHAWRVVLSFLCFSTAVLLRVQFPSLQWGALLVSSIVIVKHLVFCKCYQERIHLNLGWDFSKLRGED